MKPTIKDDRTHAYVGIVVLVAIFMGLFVAVMHGQDPVNAPQAAAKLQIPPAHKPRPLPAKPIPSVPGSADWFRERGHFKLAKFMPVLLYTSTGTLAMTSPKG